MKRAAEDTSTDTHTAKHLLWIVGLLLYLGLVWYLGLAALKNAYAAAQFLPLFGVAALEIAGEGIRVLKWRIALGQGSQAMSLFYLSRGAGWFSPGRIGELAPLLIPKYRTPKVGGWIVADRVMETAATLLFAVCGLLTIESLPLFLKISVAGAAFVGAAIGWCAIARAQSLHRTAPQISEASRIRRGLRFVSDAANEIVNLRWRLLPTIGLSIVATGIDLCQGLLLYHAFGYTIRPGLFAAIQCVHGIASIIPITPPATGAPYLAAGVLLNRYAGVPADVLTAAAPLHLAIISVVFWTLFGIVTARGRVQRFDIK